MKYKDLQDAMNLYGADQLRFYQTYTKGFSALMSAFSAELTLRSQSNTLDQSLTPHHIDTLCSVLSLREQRMAEKSVLENYEAEVFERGEKDPNTIKTNAVYRCLFKHLLNTYLHCPAEYEELEKDAISDTLKDRWQHRIESLRFYAKYSDEMARTLLMQDEKIRLSELDVQQGWVSQEDFQQHKSVYLPEFKIRLEQAECDQLIERAIEIAAKINTGVNASHEEQHAAAVLLGDYYQSKENPQKSAFWYNQAVQIKDASPRQPEKG